MENFGLSSEFIDKMISLFETCRSYASSREAAWRQCRRYGYQVWNPANSETPDSVYVPQQSSFAALCAWRAAMFLHANTVGVGQTFFRLDADDALRKELGEDSRELRDLRDMTLPLMRELADTNFSSAVGAALNDETVLGTAVAYVEFNDVKRRLEFSSYQVGTGCYLYSSSHGDADTFARSFELTPKQAYSRYGKAVGDDVIEKALSDNLGDSRIEYLWLVYPRAVYGEKVGRATREVPMVSSREKAFGHLVIDRTRKRVVEVSGYDRFPFAVSVWSPLGGSIYGWGPIEMSMRDIKRMSKLQFCYSEALDKQVDPAMIVPYSWDSFETSAGARNYVEATGLVRDAFAVVEPQAQLPDIRSDMEMSMSNIQRNCLLDAFETFDRETKTMSATEARGRTGQSVRAIASVAQSVHNGLLSALIQRSLDLLLENGILGTELPEGVARERVRVKYVSVLASMVLDAETNKLRDFFGVVAEIANARNMVGELFDVHFDTDKVFAHLADFYSIPQDVIRSKDEREKKMRELQEQAIAAQEQQQENMALNRVDPQTAGKMLGFAQQ